MAHNNYTVTSTSIEADAGTQVNLTTPTVTLTITADTGYTVTDTDFSIGDALPSEITSAVFSQNGDVVECLLTIDNSFIMPSADVDLAIDIDGAAVWTGLTIAGTYDLTTANTNLITASGTAYSGSGVEGEEVTLFTLTLTADATNYFKVDPQSIVSTLNDYPDNYTITRADTTTTVDGVALLTQVIWTVKYTFPSESVSGDTLNFTANAEEYLVIGEGGLEKYYSYDFKEFDRPQALNGDYFIGYGADQKLLRIFGDVGAEITVDWTANGGASSNLYTLEPITFAGGYIKLPIDFPVVVTDTDYLITLSGDISASFIQPNPIRVFANAGTTVTLSHNPLAGYTIVRSGVYTHSIIPGEINPGDQQSSELNTIFTITKDDGTDIALLRTPLWTDISNTDPTTNGGTSFLAPPGLIVTGSGTDTIIIEVNATITAFGSSDITCYLDLSAIFNSNPVAVDDTATVDMGGNVLIDVLANDTDANGHTLSPVIITQPTYGTVTKVGTQLRYTHNGTENYIDSFTYAANDGYINSNIATVDIVVGVAPGDSLELSATDGIFYIPVVLGDAGGEFTVHFDAGSTADRIELIYDGNIVADSLFIGDNLIGGTRTAAVAAIEATTSLNSYDYVGSGGDGLTYGQTAAWNLRIASNVVAYVDPDDIAPEGNVRGVTSNYGDQVGVGDLVYTSVVDAVGTTGLDSADGNASISLIKASGTPNTAVIKITGIAGTGWSIYQTSFV